MAIASTVPLTLPMTAHAVAARRRSWSVVVDVAVHLVMLGAMALSMADRAGVLPTLGAVAVLIAVSLALAPASRRRAHLRLSVLDLWAMIALLLVPVVSGVPLGHVHGAGTALTGAAPGVVLVADLVVLVGWTAVRLSLIADRPSKISAGVTGAGLIVMIVLCL